MNSKVIRAVVLGWFFLAVLVTFVMMFISQPVPTDKMPPPPTQQYWKCPPGGISPTTGCVKANGPGPGHFIDPEKCRTWCQAIENGSCEWSAKDGYTGHCTTDPNKGDNVPLPDGATCTDPNVPNPTCVARQKGQLQKCLAPKTTAVQWCPVDNEQCCVANQSICKQMQCCDGNNVVTENLAPACVRGQCTPVGSTPPTCTTTVSSIPYYYCSANNSFCISVTKPIPPSEAGASTNPQDGCRACPFNLAWRKESSTKPGTSTVVNWCNYSLGAPPDKTWSNAPGYCSSQGVTVPNSGWCWQDASETCASHSPQPNTCLGGPVPLTKAVFGCTTGSTANGCTEGMVPTQSPWDVGHCCAYGAMSLDGKGVNRGEFAQCLPGPQGCLCSNQPDGSTSWDGKTYPKCKFCTTQTYASPVLLQCLGSDAGQTNDGSICENGMCSCRFPAPLPGVKYCSSSNTWKVMCGGQPCTNDGCIGCTATDEPVPPNTHINCVGYSSGLPGCRQLQNLISVDDIYLCKDGSMCTVGDPDSVVDPIIAKLPSSCQQGVRAKMRYCANNSGTCDTLANVLPNNPVNSSRCVNYNSLARAEEHSIYTWFEQNFCS